MYDDEKKKDEITQRIYDILEKYDWGGDHKKMIIKLVFKGRMWFLDPEIIIKENKNV